MATMTGTVDKIDSRVVKTKFGPKPVYDLYVGGTKYGYGFKNPQLIGVQQGTTVEFEAGENNGYMNVVADSLKVISSGPANNQGITRSITATSNNVRSGFPVDTTSDKFAIIRQNALTNAVATVEAFTGQVNSMSPNTLEAYVNLVIKTAYTFTDFSSGQREMKAARKLQRNQPQAMKGEDVNETVSHMLSDEIEANHAYESGDE